MSKKRRPRVALISLVGLILVLLVGTFTWLHFNSTRQLPLGSRQKVERLPRVKIKGAVSQTVDKNPTVRFSFKDRKTGVQEDGYATMKWQGQSSRRYPQKNWKIKFYKDKSLKHKLKWRAAPGWKKHSSYVLKANYIDATQSRNVVNSQLWSDMVATRSGAPKQLADSQNNGAISGFPIEMKVNGDRWGLYTLNTPKDAKLWGLDKHDPTNIAISSNEWDKADMFWSDKVRYNATGWTPDVPDSLTRQQKQDFERLVHFVNTSDTQTFRQHAPEYLDVNSVIDMYLFANLIHDQDGLGRNLELLTYNGQIWHATMYDLDSTWGLYENGRHIYPSGEAVSHNYPNHGDLKTAEGNRLLQQVVQAYPERVQSRWRQLRKSTLTPTKVNDEFTTFMTTVGDPNYQDNFQRNPGIPSKKITSLMQIRNSVNRQFKDCDALFNDYTGNVKRLNFNYVAPTPTESEKASSRAKASSAKAQSENSRNDDSSDVKLP
ncbi:CotH kinase family protein [Furfurilactobacillus rossiae]|uniref:Spore coat protein CotH n=1 Tax=Furfurilactobacillus rossiae DSM 15814 TaxID=1114972 RepID=A0A0R1RD87_9LACO|nr:CotH kinase family protein [Furfurilactobacillus rossiae]KRL54382.1 hypothetical protein FD35_GL002724 [Furfurilactobacillus rossiae DSM 15814]QFR66893.1 hypothetical protein LR814_07180 [Furfurilactobacillus rossiae]QLE62386.1 hypothetical protein LROSRS0_2341 [Furfurilactobacillus rossiae]